MVNPISKTLLLSLLCAVFLFPYAFFTFEFFPFLFTFTILILSIVFLVRITERKERLDFDAIPDSKILLEVKEEDRLKPEKVETVAEGEASKEEDENSIGTRMESTTQSPSDFESSTDDDSDTSENLDDSIWMRNQNSEMSDDDSVSIDDEDGLIEITIPGVHSNFQATKQNFPESIFRHQDLADLLAEINEVNEEENLIEIDISMGSIKCPRFEIEA